VEEERNCCGCVGACLDADRSYTIHAAVKLELLARIGERRRKAAMKIQNIRRALAGTCALCSLPLWTGSAPAQALFYQGKTITVVAGTDAGGTADLRIKTVVASLRKHIPGNPTIVVEYMPGGGGRKAANHVFRTSRPDGLTIGAMLSSMVPSAVVGETGVLYDIDKLIYLGTLTAATRIYF
jgi:tripartite-type tricarboxylate transporter receptor subunit TctC